MRKYVMTLAALVLLTSLLGLHPPQGWTSYELTDQGLPLRASFPTRPQTNVTEGNPKSITYTAGSGGVTYAIVAAVSSTGTYGLAQVQDTYKKVAARGQNASAGEASTVSGIEAVAGRYQNSSGSFVVYRAVAHKNALYQLMVIKNGSYAPDQAANQFFNSIRIGGSTGGNPVADVAAAAPAPASAGSTAGGASANLQNPTGTSATPIKVQPNKPFTFRGRIDGGLSYTTEQLTWAEKMPYTLTPSLYFNEIRGKTVYYILEQKGPADVTIKLKPVEGNKRINLYICMDPEPRNGVPPNLTNVRDCSLFYNPHYAPSSKFPEYQFEPGEERVYNHPLPAGYTIRYLIGVCGAKGTDSGEFELTVDVKTND